jgi:hypothetical protein
VTEEKELTPEEQRCLQEFLHWLFNDANGHFAILVAMLIATSICWLCHVPQADKATSAIFGYVLAKLK